MRATRQLGRYCRVLAAAIVFLTVLHRWSPSTISAQDEVADADLARASAGRALRIGTPGSRRVADMPLEVYVARVLSGEGEPRAADAAQQALAIAIRTYARFNEGRHLRDGYDLCDTTHCQVLRSSTAAARRAAMATAGQILTFDGRPAELFYSASCGGRSEAASAVWPGMSYPYLPSVPDDVHEDDVPWTLDLSLHDIQDALVRAGFSGRRLTAIDVDALTPSGRVGRLHVSGMTPDVITGEELRRAIGPNTLKSTAFRISGTDSGVRFVGRGFGHGVGLCVVGAGRRALRGELAPAILSRYFPGLVLTSIGGAAPAPPRVETTAASASAAPAVVPRRNTSVIISGSTSAGGNRDIERIAADAHAELSRDLGVSVAPITIRLHDTIEQFRTETGRPWWVSAVVSGTTVSLAPLPLLDQRDGITTAIRMAIAELLTGSALAGRPAWVRVGAGRYFGHGTTAPSPSSKPKCPSDAELTLATSVTAQRDAEARAEACFARAYRSARDWREVR